MSTNNHHARQRNCPNPDGGPAPSRLKKDIIMLKPRKNLQPPAHDLILCKYNFVNSGVLDYGGEIEAKKLSYFFHAAKFWRFLNNKLASDKN